MKKLSLLFLLITTIGYSQSYNGLAGYLTVDNNTWTLKFQNNEFYYINDEVNLSFDNKQDVEQFYQDLLVAIDTKDNTIEGNGYTLVSSKKQVVVMKESYRDKYMVFVKKYSKPGLAAIQESISYMN
jgi:hypothetical protein